MLSIAILAAAFAGWRITRAAIASLRALPRRNEDMVFY